MTVAVTGCCVAEGLRFGEARGNEVKSGHVDVKGL